jgi:hypothetical protein
MVMLTVIGRRLAKVGKEFTFFGSISNCKDCKVRNICFHLEKGSKYRVVEVRKVPHECPMHEDGVLVVQVEEIPRIAVIPGKMAMEGSTVSYEVPRCNRKGCANRALCVLPGMERGQKKRILNIREKVDCPIGQNRVRVTLQ